MKIHLVSDIHTEFYTNKLKYIPPEGTDIVVLAGDIGVGRQGVLWAMDTFTCPVIYVAGNHEAYGNNWKIPKLYDTLRELTVGSNIHFLQNETKIIGDVAFIGATLWTDFNLMGNQPLAKLDAIQSMNDFRKIKFGRAGQQPDRLTPDILEEEFLFSKKFIEMEMKRLSDKKIVIVTHHAPSELSINERYKGQLLNSSFASNLDYFIMDHNPRYWFHGHMHDSADYNIGDTRIVCNPMGYNIELNRGFNNSLLLEI